MKTNSLSAMARSRLGLLPASLGRNRCFAKRDAVFRRCKQMRILLLAPFLIAVFFAEPFVASARADDIAPCPLPHGVVSTSLQHGTPQAVLRALKEQVADIVPPGGRFDATDVIIYGRNRRLIFIWNSGRRWVVATERGGIAYSDPIFAFDLPATDGSAILVQERDAIPLTVCSTATRLLDLRRHAART
jgi:hypothetical protein